MRSEIDLPPLTDPDYGQKAAEASAELTTASLAETFVAAGVLVVIALLVATMMRRPTTGSGVPTEPSKPIATEPEQAAKGVPMKQFIVRNLSPIVIGSAVLFAALLAGTVFLAIQVSSLSADLDDARSNQAQLAEDVARVEGGAALYAAQVTAFQEQIGTLGPTLDSALGEAVTGIDTFRNSQITFDVAIDETVPIDAEIVLDRTLQVPINTTIPIDETFDTTITVNGPFGVDIPLDITVPIKLDLPIDLEVAIPVNETIPVNTEVPVNLDVPIVIDIAETELAALADSLQHGLESFRQLAAGLG